MKALNLTTNPVYFLTRLLAGVDRRHAPAVIKAADPIWRHARIASLSEETEGPNDRFLFLARSPEAAILRRALAEDLGRFVNAAGLSAPAAKLQTILRGELEGHPYRNVPEAKWVNANLDALSKTSGHRWLGIWQPPGIGKNLLLASLIRNFQRGARAVGAVIVLTPSRKITAPYIQSLLGEELADETGVIDRDSREPAEVTVVSAFDLADEPSLFPRDPHQVVLAILDGAFMIHDADCRAILTHLSLGRTVAGQGDAEFVPDEDGRGLVIGIGEFPTEIERFTPLLPLSVEREPIVPRGGSPREGPVGHPQVKRDAGIAREEKTQKRIKKRQDLERALLKALEEAEKRAADPSTDPARITATAVVDRAQEIYYKEHPEEEPRPLYAALYYGILPRDEELKRRIGTLISIRKKRREAFQKAVKRFEQALDRSRKQAKTGDTPSTLLSDVAAIVAAFHNAFLKPGERPVSADQLLRAARGRTR